MASWKRTYWVVWIANLVTAVGMMSFLPFFPGYLEELGVEDRDAVAAWSGVVFGAAPLVAAFMAPIWGAFGDRVGRKAMVVRALLAIALFVGAMGFVTSPWQLLALRVAQGVFSGFVAPSITLVSIGAPPALQGRVAGNLQTSLAAGSILGPLAGAAVADALGLRAVFAAVACAALVGLVLVALLAEEDHSLRVSAEEHARAGMLAGLRGDLDRMRSNLRLRRAVFLFFFIHLGIGATQPQLQLFVRDLTDAPEARVRSLTALLFTLQSAMALVTTPLWGRHADRGGSKRVLDRTAAWTAGTLALHAAVPAWGLLALARVVLGGVSSGSGPSAFGVAAAESDIDRRGSAFGVVFSARALALSLAAGVGGWLAALVTIRGLFLLGGGVVLVALLVFGRSGEPASRAPRATLP